jgi:hypothetical protein
MNVPVPMHPLASALVTRLSVQAVPESKPGLFSVPLRGTCLPVRYLWSALRTRRQRRGDALTVVFPEEQPVYTQREIQLTDQFMQKVLGPGQRHWRSRRAICKKNTDASGQQQNSNRPALEDRR